LVSVESQFLLLEKLILCLLQIEVPPGLRVPVLAYLKYYVLKHNEFAKAIQHAAS